MSSAKKMDFNQNESRIDYAQLDKELALKVHKDFQRKLEKEFDGNHESFRRVVLGNVKNSAYELAQQAVDAYVQSRRQYPKFAGRVAPLVTHCNDLISSIETKRNFPNMHLLSMTKQKEILDQVLDHFNELKQALKTIERVAKDEALVDLKSTRSLIKITSFTILTVIFSVFLVSFDTELGQPFWVVIDDFARTISDFFFSLFGL